MSTIIYFSNQMIQAVEPKGKNAYICQEKAPEGSVINGMVTDPEAFGEFLKDFFKKNKLSRKDCKLVVSSSQITVRSVGLPKCSESDLQKLIGREFGDSKTDQTLFLHYVMQSDKRSKMQNLLIAAAEKSYIESTAKVFTDAGIEVTSLEPAVVDFTRRFMSDVALLKKNCIFQILDGQEIISILFVKGSYLFSQRNRVFSEAGTEGLTREAFSIVRRLQQFATAQKVADPIEILYLCGNDSSKLGANMVTEENSPIKVIPYRSKLAHMKRKNNKQENIEFIYPGANLIRTVKGMDFLEAVKKSSPEEILKKQRKEMILPGAVTLFAGLLVTAVLGYLFLHQRGQVNLLNQQIEQMNAQGTVYDLAEANAGRMKNQTKGAELLWKHLMSYPTIQGQIADDIDACAVDGIEVTVRSFNRDTGVVVLEASAKQVSNISEFIDKLESLPEFADVEYSGYVYMSITDTYSISVVCLMEEGAGR